MQKKTCLSISSTTEKHFLFEKVDLSSSIGTVKRLVEEEGGIPRSRQQLFSRDVHLDDEARELGDIDVLWEGESVAVAHLLVVVTPPRRGGSAGWGNALCSSAEHGCLAAVRWLVETMEVSVEERNQDGDTALVCATGANSRDVVRWLVTEGGANVENRGGDGKTPLLVATEEGDLGLVQWLLHEGGSRLDVRDDDGRSVWNAAFSGWEGEEQRTPFLCLFLALGGVPPKDFDVGEHLSPSQQRLLQLARPAEE